MIETASPGSGVEVASSFGRVRVVAVRERCAVDDKFPLLDQGSTGVEQRKPLVSVTSSPTYLTGS